MIQKEVQGEIENREGKKEKCKINSDPHFITQATILAENEKKKKLVK